MGIRSRWVGIFFILWFAQPVLAFEYYGSAQTVTSALLGNRNSSERFSLSESFHLNARQIGLKNLSFRSHLVVQSQIDRDWDQRERYRFNYGYFEIKDILELGDLAVGRQYLNVGPYLSSFDGVSLQLEQKQFSALKVYYGAEAPTDDDHFQRWADSRIIGGQISMDAIERTKASLSYQRLERHDRLDVHALSLDASRFVPYWELTVHGGVDFDLIRDRVQRFSLEAKYLFYTGTQIYAEFVHRKPYTSPHNLMAVFKQSAANEIHIGFRAKKIGDFQFVGTYTPTFYSESTAHHLNMGIRSPFGMFSVGGSQIGDEQRVSAFYSHALRLTNRLNVSLNFNWFQYEYLEVEDTLANQLLLQGRFRYIFNKSLTVQLDLENGYRQEPSSMRFVRIRSAITYRFAPGRH